MHFTRGEQSLAPTCPEKEGRVVAGQIKEMRNSSEFSRTINKERKERKKQDVKKRNKMHFKFLTETPGFPPDGSLRIKGLKRLREDFPYGRVRSPKNSRLGKRKLNVKIGIFHNIPCAILHISNFGGKLDARESNCGKRRGLIC